MLESVTYGFLNKAPGLGDLTASIEVLDLHQRRSYDRAIARKEVIHANR